MSYIVSITSQGQISIPAKIRRELGLDKKKKALVTVKEGNIVVEPVKDLLELRGSLKTTIKATRKQIRDAFETYLGKEAVKGIR
ncbi:AbrB/MazE/SpoVT family DNA-binding domain-containing protein [Candidatus Curtissbacteria bacterium]|nr:AbrB/MazE/SpoVT family DNA-binding domain-containing protein [Candidatus Curtissbacteria bacterium]